MRIARQFFKDNFGPMSLELIQQPPNSPDLNPLDFSVWSAVEGMMRKSATDHELRGEVARAFKLLQDKPGFAKKVGESFMRRIGACIAAGGGAFEI